MIAQPLRFGLPVEGITIVTEFKPSKSFAYRLVSPGYFTGMSYDFIAVPNGTRVSIKVLSSRNPKQVGTHVAPFLDRLAAIVSDRES